eukprot:4032155-Pleurochrysis_carterae.AAC.1
MARLAEAAAAAASTAAEAAAKGDQNEEEFSSKIAAEALTKVQALSSKRKKLQASSDDQTRADAVEFNDDDAKTDLEVRPASHRGSGAKSQAKLVKVSRKRSRVSAEGGASRAKKSKVKKDGAKRTASETRIVCAPSSEMVAVPDQQHSDTDGEAGDSSPNSPIADTDSRCVSCTMCSELHAVFSLSLKDSQDGWSAF